MLRSQGVGGLGNPCKSLGIAASHFEGNCEISLTRSNTN